MATTKRVFTLRLTDDVFDKIGTLAANEHRSMTNYIEYVLIKHLEQVEQERGVIDTKKAVEEEKTVSVLKAKRTTSKAEFVNTANQLYVETLNFLTRLSARYSRLIAEDIAHLAGGVVDQAEMANSIYPSDDQRKTLRKAHLLEARASLKALDVRLTHCYLLMMQNPEGCFTNSKGVQLKSADAVEKLDRMAESFRAADRQGR